MDQEIAYPESGSLHVLPFKGVPLADRIAPIYQSLMEDGDRDVTDILVLKRLPTGVPEFAKALREATGLQSVPNVKSVARHASSVLEESAPNLQRLRYEERIEFLANVLAGANWPNYLDRASQHDSFGRDAGQLLLDATWEGGFDFDTHPRGDYKGYLEALSRTNERFHEQLATRDLIEQADVIPRAHEALDEPRVRHAIEREFEAILVVEFEEYSWIERSYIAKLASNAELVCVGERSASIERVRREAGSLDTIGAGLERPEHTPADDRGESRENSRPGGAIAHFLATGETPADGSSESDAPDAYLIEGSTFENQIREVANEIEYLRDKEGWEYADFALLLKSVGDPMPEVRRILAHSGIPTATMGTSGLEQDLAVRELHALAQYNIDRSDRARELLEARVPEFDHDLVDRSVVHHSIADSLEAWISNTDLKRRIANEADDIDAREQFQNVSKLLSIARFVDDQDILDSGWFEFKGMLERAITYDAPYAHTAEVDVQEGGVVVGDVSLLKNDGVKVVFLINVVDSEYPGSERLSPLFPTAWIKQMPAYPAVSTPTAADITETFDTVEELRDDPFQRYHAEITRRKLAIGARAATDRLYFTTYQSQSGALNKRQHRSRYLNELSTQAKDVEIMELAGAGKDRAIYTLGSASTTILREPWNKLEQIQAAASVGNEVQLEETEDRFAAIQTVIDESDGVHPQFVDAVDTHMEFARGAIDRESATGATDTEPSDANGSVPETGIETGGEVDD